VSRTETSFDESVYSEPPGLGSLSRFASGRRSESWRVGVWNWNQPPFSLGYFVFVSYEFGCWQPRVGPISACVHWARSFE
jgi:hypothetical protein